MVADFNILGAKYPLYHHLLTPHDSLCVSNEFAEDEVEISFPLGEVILMETRDTPKMAGERGNSGKNRKRGRKNE